MKKLYSGLSHAVSSLESNNVGSTTTSTDPFFLKHKRKILTLIAGGLIGGCGGGSMDRENETNPEVADTSRMQKLSASIPLTSVPTSAPFEVDGMIGYGWIYFEHPISGYASGPYINPFQSNNYNPRDVLTKLGVTEWIIVRASFSYDADRDNDGKADSTWTPINSSMSMLVHRSVLERGEKIIFSPRSAFISESILSRSGKIISGGALDTIAREAGTDDTNQDGIINYSDITSKKWSSGTTGSLSLPGFSSYMESVYKGNGVTRGNALKNLQKMQNHTVISIAPHPTNHDPLLKIETIGTGSILYTLDGSSPLPGAPNTIVAQSGVVIPLQDKRIYYRESIQNGTEIQLGKVKSFDLATDWMELSQQGQKYNTTGKETLDETSHAYNGKNYKVRSISNKTSPGFTYPKFLDCQVGPSALDGCHLGPYVAYNEVHEAKIRELIHAAAQAHINTAVTTPPDTNPPTNPGSTPTAPTHYQNELTNHTTKINYLGGWYHVQNQWNTSGTKDFPVTTIGMYATPDGIRQANITSIANNEAERLQFSQAMVGRLKGIIEAKLSNLPKPTYPQNYIIPSNPVSYKGYSYTLITTMNTTGYSDYPASVKVKYTTPNGPKETPVLPAKDPTELAKVQTERTNEAKSQIDMSLGLDEYAPYQVVTLTPRRYYSGGSYRTIFTYSGITGKDYPGYIDVIYRRSNGSTGKWTMEVMSETQRNLFVPQGEEQAKLEIDNFPLKGVNQIIKYANTPYGNKGGTYTRYEKYNRKGTGYNYPALIWYEYRATPNSPLLDTRNTYGVTEARNSEHLGEIATTLESWVRGQMIAIGPMDSPNKYASITGSRILDIIVPSAHAADTPSSIVSKNNATKLTSLSPYSADVSFFRSYNIGNPVQDFFMKPGFTAPSGKSKVNVVGKSAEEARVRGIKRQIESSIASIDEYIKRLPGDSNRCTGIGLSTQEQCITEQYPGIEGILRDRQAAIDAFNQVLNQETLSMDDAIQFVVDMFNDKGELLGTKKDQLLLNNNDFAVTLNMAIKEAVTNEKEMNFKYNTRLPIIRVVGDRVIRGVIINGITITSAELGNLGVGFLGGKAGFSFEHLVEWSRNYNALKYWNYGKSNAFNLSVINEASDSLLYKGGFEKGITQGEITKEDLLIMFNKYYREYKTLADTEESRIQKYKDNNGLK